MDGGSIVGVGGIGVTVGAGVTVAGTGVADAGTGEFVEIGMLVGFVVHEDNKAVNNSITINRFMNPSVMCIGLM